MDHLTAQPFRGLHIDPSGVGSQIQNQTLWGKDGQFLRAKEKGRDGVENDLILGKLPGHLDERNGGEPVAFRPGQLLVFPRSNADLSAQSGKSLGSQLSHPSTAGDQHLGLVDGDGKLLHGQLDSALGGGNAVGDDQFLPGEIIVDRQAPFLEQGSDGGGDTPGADLLPGRKLPQDVC